MVSEYAPPRRMMLLGVALGCFLAGVAATVGTLMDWGPPAQPPILVEDTRSSYVERDGQTLWRVEMDVQVLATCQVVKVDRSFAQAGGGPVWRQVPITSYVDAMGMALGSAPYSVDLPPGRTLIWHEYAITRPTAGHLIVEVFATSCEGNRGRAWSGTLGTWTLAFDWRGRVPARVR